MRVLTYKAIVLDSREYKRMMNVMGKCLKEGWDADLVTYIGKAPRKPKKRDTNESVTLIDLTLSKLAH